MSRDRVGLCVRLLPRNNSKCYRGGIGIWIVTEQNLLQLNKNKTRQLPEKEREKTCPNACTLFKEK